MHFKLSKKGIGLICGLFSVTYIIAQPAQHSGQEKFIDPANMDVTVKPGDDFNFYANGTWIKNNPVPAKETRWGSFNVLRDFNIQAVKGLLENAAADSQAPAGSVSRRVADFYIAGMDSILIDRLGYNPIKEELKRIAKLKNKPEVILAIAKARTDGNGSPLYGFFVGQDRKNVEVMIPQFSQGGTTLPDRNYYFSKDVRSREILTAYKDYIVKLFSLTGSKPAEAEKNAEVIIGIETALAHAQMPRVQMRDPQKTYNKLSVKDFSQSTAMLNWNNLLPVMQVNGVDSVLVNNPAFFVKADSLVQATSVNDLKTYLTWNVLKSSPSYLSSEFVAAEFAFNQVLTGQKEQTPRWQRVAQLTDRSIGDLLGQLYVAEYFTAEAKSRMDELIKNLVKAYEIRIKNLEWMSDVTKEKALEKLYAFVPKIGHTEKWETYQGLEIKPSTFYTNVKNVNKWSYSEMVKRLGKPVDRTRFGMTPPTVNAYYSPTMNEIVFPAGILQFPFFDPKADDAFNYGGIGAVIGHEISHGFDDSGSQYDKNGNLRNWWTDEDRTRFTERANKIVEQFNNYTVLDTIKVNGRLTLGENIGDLGGLNAAYTAFKMTKQGQSNEIIDGFTPDQRFFLAWAQVWRANTLPSTAAQLILTDSHSPAQWRVVGPLVHMDAWYEAFNVQPGDKLYIAPEERIRLW